MVTEAMINEYLKNEANLEWIYNFIGKTAAKEPILWAWLEQLLENEVTRLATKAPTVFAHPLLGSSIFEIGKAMFFRGYFMGMRKYETSWETLFSQVRFDNERPPTEKKRKRKKGENKDITGGESEISPDDLAP
jgi:hypothetical protein